jgi:hypothetical protein
MQVIAAGSPPSRTARIGIARATLSGALMIVVGAMLAWAFVATPLISSFAPDGRPSAAQAAAAIVVWGLAIVLPAGFLLLGLARILSVLDMAAGQHPGTITPGLAKHLGPELVAVTNLVLPGGRRVHELVLGPFGIAVLAEVPPPSMSRHAGSRWEVRGPRGRWFPIEAPLDRAARDAERVRGWLSSDDRDFLVKVYAAIVTDDERVERSASCAVVRQDALVGWLAALPAQRGLTDERRERLADLLRSVATGQ